MKKIITFGLVCLLSLFVQADTNKEQAEVVSIEMYCFTTDQVAGTLKQFGEIPLAIGKAFDLAGSTMSLWTNPSTETWTLVATKQNVSCILGTGERLQLLKSGKII